MIRHMTNATYSRRSLFVAYSFRELESVMTPGKEQQVRAHILVHKLEAERAQWEWHGSSETFKPSLSDTPSPSKSLLLLPKQFLQLGTTYESVGPFSFKQPQRETEDDAQSPPLVSASTHMQCRTRPSTTCRHKHVDTHRAGDNCTHGMSQLISRKCQETSAGEAKSMANSQGQGGDS